MKQLNRENLVALRMAYDALVKAGTDSLHSAYNFGQIIDALYGAGYSYLVMAGELGRSPGTMQLYARLYRRYPTLDALLMTSERAGTFDIAKLAGSAGTLQAKYGYQCGNCGSFDTHKVRRPDPETARS